MPSTLTPSETMTIQESTTALLEAGRRRLTGRPDAWIKVRLAEDNNGRPCWPTAPDAVRWCAVGAIYAGDPALGSKYAQAATAQTAEAALDAASGCERATLLNDLPQTRLEDVIAMYDRAIARLGGKPAP